MVTRAMFNVPELNETAALIAQHLPQGRAWGRRGDLDSNLGKLTVALAASLRQVQSAIFALSKELNIGLTNDLLLDWESSVGLPDECVDLAADLAARRARIIERLRRAPTTTAQQVEAIVLALTGSVVSVSSGADAEIFPMNFPVQFNGVNNPRFKVYVDFPGAALGFNALPSVGTNSVASPSGTLSTFNLGVTSPYASTYLISGVAIGYSTATGGLAPPAGFTGVGGELTVAPSSMHAVAVQGDAGGAGVKGAVWDIPDTSSALTVAAGYTVAISEDSPGSAAISNAQTGTASATLAAYAITAQERRQLVVAVSQTGTTTTIGDGQSATFNGVTMGQGASVKSGLASGVSAHTALYMLDNPNATGDVVIGGSNNNDANMMITAFTLDGVQNSNYMFPVPLGTVESPVLQCVLEKVLPANVVPIVR